MKILIAEDDGVSRRRLEAALASWGHEAVVACDGRQAWEVLQKDDSPELAILDWMMPGMDGLEVVRKVRERYKALPTYVIILTAQDNTDDVVQALQAGADEYITKPFHPLELRARIQVGVRVVQLQRILARRVFELESALNARKLVEQELIKESSLLCTLMDNLPDPIYFKDTSSRFTRINLAQARRFGLSDPEMAVGKTDFNFFSPEHAQPTYEDEQKIIKTGQPLVGKEEKETWPDGREGWVVTTKMPLRDPHGHIVGTFGVSRDITERRLAEEGLYQSEERARLLFATIPYPVWVYDAETLDFLEVNNAAAEHYGYSRDEFLRMKITDIRPPEEIERLMRDLKAPRPLGQSSGQWKHRTKDGRIIEVETSSHTLEFGGRQAILVSVQDVTEKKRLEVELRHSQKLEAVGSLAAGIAHEINTPIQFVGDNTRFLQDSFPGLRDLLAKYKRLCAVAAAGSVSPELVAEVIKAEETADIDYLVEEVPKALSQTLDGVDRVATIVRAMKDFAHPDRSEKASADLKKALESTLIVAYNEIKYVADVETDLSDLPPVRCHLGDINQVFLNLLINAAHAVGDTVKGTGRKGKIRVKTRRDGDHVEVAISDTGCGIPEDIRNRIFDPFFTTKEVGRGTGQGLAIARSVIVDKHGGTLTFESEVGRGTTFFVRLPTDGSISVSNAVTP